MSSDEVAKGSQVSRSEDASPNVSSQHDAPGPKQERIGLRQRVKHFTFAWFLATMSTGGLSIAIAETPHKFKGLHTIGIIIFFLNLTLFLTLCALMTSRAILHPKHFRKSFTNPLESPFIGAFWLSISVILGGIQVYGITHGPHYHWLVDAVYVLYWVYAGLSLANSLAQYYILMAASIVRPAPFTPAMFLPGYSAMLTGTIASLIAGSQTPERSLLVIVSGLAYQGFGWLISLVCIVYFVRTLLDNGLPPLQLRPAMFIPVGSAAYTIVAFIGLARAIPSAPESGYFSKHPGAKEMLEVMALFVSIFLWLFSFWMFAIAVIGNVGGIGKMRFSLTWWAFIFPNVGFMLATAMVGEQLESQAVLWVASAMTVLLVAIWGVSVVGCVRAVWAGKIVWPGKDEDKNV